MMTSTFATWLFLNYDETVCDPPCGALHKCWRRRSIFCRALRSRGYTYICISLIAFCCVNRNRGTLGYRLATHLGWFYSVCPFLDKRGCFSFQLKIKVDIFLCNLSLKSNRMWLRGKAGSQRPWLTFSRWLWSSNRRPLILRFGDSGLHDSEVIKEAVCEARTALPFFLSSLWLIAALSPVNPPYRQCVVTSAMFSMPPKLGPVRQGKLSSLGCFSVCICCCCRPTQLRHCSSTHLFCSCYVSTFLFLLLSSTLSAFPWSRLRIGWWDYNVDGLEQVMQNKIQQSAVWEPC
jgi:hypothetical protein